MPTKSSIHLTCPQCRSRDFEACILKDEGVGAVKCLQCARDYLLLDSGDYWFDVIQNRPYPKPSRCACKGTALRLTINYGFRDDGDIRTVDVQSTCADCGKSRRQLKVDIDYSPTQQLLDQPLTYCKNPQILYDLREISLYAKRTDIARVARFLSDELGCEFAASLREKDQWHVRSVDVDEAETAIVKATAFSLRYQWIYAFPRPIKVTDATVGGAKREDAFWKRREIIRISSPTHMQLRAGRPSLLYYLHFSNEYVKNERVVAKSKRFRDLTARLVEWLGTEFVTWRGANCFDDPEEHVRAFGDHYRKKTSRGK